MSKRLKKIPPRITDSDDTKSPLPGNFSVCQTVYCFTMKRRILCGYCLVLGFVIASIL